MWMENFVPVWSFVSHSSTSSFAVSLSGHIELLFTLSPWFPAVVEEVTPDETNAEGCGSVCGCYVEHNWAISLDMFCSPGNPAHSGLIDRLFFLHKHITVSLWVLDVGSESGMKPVWCSNMSVCVCLPVVQLSNSHLLCPCAGKCVHIFPCSSALRLLYRSYIKLCWFHSECLCDVRPYCWCLWRFCASDSPYWSACSPPVFLFNPLPLFVSLFQICQRRRATCGFVMTPPVDSEASAGTTELSSNVSASSR